MHGRKYGILMLNMPGTFTCFVRWNIPFWYPLSWLKKTSWSIYMIGSFDWWWISNRDISRPLWEFIPAVDLISANCYKLYNLVLAFYAYTKCFVSVSFAFISDMRWRNQFEPFFQRCHGLSLVEINSLIHRLLQHWISYMMQIRPCVFNKRCTCKML